MTPVRYQLEGVISNAQPDMRHQMYSAAYARLGIPIWSQLILLRRTVADAT